MSIQIALNIYEQLWAKALLMLGCTNRYTNCTHKNSGIQFDIRGSMSCDRIRINYNYGKDLFDIEYLQKSKDRL